MPFLPAVSRCMCRICEVFSGPGNHTIPGIINEKPLTDWLSYSVLSEYLSAVLTNRAALRLSEHTEMTFFLKDWRARAPLYPNLMFFEVTVRMYWHFWKQWYFKHLCADKGRYCFSCYDISAALIWQTPFLCEWTDKSVMRTLNPSRGDHLLHTRRNGEIWHSYAQMCRLPLTHNLRSSSLLLGQHFLPSSLFYISSIHILISTSS